MLAYLLQAIEWKRPFGRASKTVCLNASFVRFDAEAVTRGAQLRRLIGVPVLHTFWMECADLDSYKVRRPSVLPKGPFIFTCGEAGMSMLH